MIGKKLKERRLELGLTQEELARMVGYTSKSTINKIEKDYHDVNQSTLIKLSNALKVSPTYFIEGYQAEAQPSEAIMTYAKKLAALSPEKQENAMQYIDFLISKD